MKSGIIFGIAGLISGALVGFVTGYYAAKKRADDEMNYILSQRKEEEPVKEEAPAPVKDEKSSEMDTLTKKASKIISPGPAKIAMPGKDGINYTAYAKKVEELKYKEESEHPKDSDEDEGVEENADGESLNPDDFTQTYEERVMQDNIELTKEFETYKKKRKKPFYIFSKGYDEEWPDIHYDEKLLYYFTTDDLLTDEDGNFVKEESTIGPDLRKYGWFINRNMTETMVRNMVDEVDYKIKKMFTSYDDFFPNSPNPMDDDEEIE